MRVKELDRLLDESRRLRAELENLVGRAHAEEQRDQPRQQNGRSPFPLPVGRPDPETDD